MHIGLNLVYLVPGETGGMETYARELIRALVHEKPDLKLTAFVNREVEEAGDAPWGEFVRSVTVPVHARNRSQWVRGEQQLLPPLAERAGVDLLHSLASTAPAWGAFARVVTIQDVIYRIHPRAHPGLRSLAMRILVPLAARRSHRIVVPSRATRGDLIRLLKVSPEKIDVVPYGIGSLGAPTWPSEEELRRLYDLGTRPVVLTASAKRPHKNLMRALDALALISRERRPILVLPGYATAHEQELRARANRLDLAADTRFLGWVSERALEGLYHLSACFVYPSLYEGFGLPVLEAMARGVPVATSNRGALAEVVNGAALTFDPERPEAIAEAIETLLEKREVRDRLRAAGRENAARFSWAETARRMVRTYEHTLESSR